jgi:uncharacterized protein (TIGR00725 family)
MISVKLTIIYLVFVLFAVIYLNRFLFSQAYLNLKHLKYNLSITLPFYWSGIIMIIGVIGSSNCTEDIAELAEDVGRRIAKSGATLVCGGLGGVMEHVCKGARSEGGTTIGIVPSGDKSDANDYVEIPIATGISVARNLIIVNTADVLIALAGGYGTLSEIAFALNLRKPVIALKTWALESAGKVDDELFFRVDDAKTAVDLALKLVDLS